MGSLLKMETPWLGVPTAISQGGPITPEVAKQLTELYERTMKKSKASSELAEKRDGRV